MIRARARALPALKQNAWEREYALMLEADRRAGRITAWRWSPFRLLLADATTYLPDFLVIAADGTVELHEVKGFMRDDARCKLMVASEAFPWFLFRLAVKRAKKAGGGWEITTVPTLGEKR